MKKITLFILTLFSLSKVEAQQGLPFYNHYLVSDKMLINPSYAGQDPNVISITGTHRNQWDDLPESPSTQTVSAHGIIVDRLAVGMQFFNDRNGAVKMTGFGINAAYHIPIDDEVMMETKSMFFRLELELLMFRNVLIIQKLLRKIQMILLYKKINILLILRIWDCLSNMLVSLQECRFWIFH
jgi:hypothetical protein